MCPAFPRLGDLREPVEGYKAGDQGGCVTDSSEKLVARGAMALLTEIVRQADDAAAPGEVKDLADALAVLAPLVRAPQAQTEGI